MLSHQTLKVVADSVNPVLGILAVGLPFVKWQGQWRPSSMHISITVLTVLLMYLLRALFRLETVWAGWGLDFSTHTAVCVILVLGLASLDWKKSWTWTCVFLGYAVLMVYQGYHSWIDIGTTAFVVLLFAAPMRYVGERWGRKVVQSGATSTP